jgi:hypothetical protein
MVAQEVNKQMCIYTRKFRNWLCSFTFECINGRCSGFITYSNDMAREAFIEREVDHLFYLISCS